MGSWREFLGPKKIIGRGYSIIFEKKFKKNRARINECISVYYAVQAGLPLTTSTTTLIIFGHALKDEKKSKRIKQAIEKNSFANSDGIRKEIDAWHIKDVMNFVKSLGKQEELMTIEEAQKSIKECLLTLNSIIDSGLDIENSDEKLASLQEAIQSLPKLSQDLIIEMNQLCEVTESQTDDETDKEVETEVDEEEDDEEEDDEEEDDEEEDDEEEDDEEEDGEEEDDEVENDNERD